MHTCTQLGGSDSEDEDDEDDDNPMSKVVVPSQKEVRSNNTCTAQHSAAELEMTVAGLTGPFPCGNHAQTKFQS